MFKIIIAGSRTFDDYDMLVAWCDHYLSSKLPDVEIVSGACSGADKLGELYAKERGIKVISFPANWDKYGKGAGFRRNTKMAQYADACIAFWDGSSKGTEHMIGLCNHYGLLLRVVKFVPVVVDVKAPVQGILKLTDDPRPMAKGV